MKRTLIFGALLVGALAAGGIKSARADTEGCKVYLCISSSTPGWRNVPYCVPPVTAAIAAWEGWGSMPSCPEGGSAFTSLWIRMFPLPFSF